MKLKELRSEITEIDSKIIELIAERQQLSAKIAAVKRQQNIPIVDNKQREKVLERTLNEAVTQNINPVSIQEIFEILISMNEEKQREFSGEGNLP
ncbi:MAG: chorismate mutase [Euryarchaeota archaeon]|nr:chorismate mutase [Euryarchaeota archaeon]